MFEDVRRYIEATVEQLTPAKAQQLAKQLLEPDARKEQVTKAAQELVDWSQRNRERLKDFVAREVKQQLGSMGLASQTEVDGLKRRVRDLERKAGMTATGRIRTASAAPTTTSKKPAKRPARKPARKPAAKRPTTGK
jgi:polyhydroxyalkanoate synthesis regulator phasin